MRPVVVEGLIWTEENTANLSRDDLISIINHMAWLLADEKTRERARLGQGGR